MNLILPANELIDDDWGKTGQNGVRKSFFKWAH